MYQQIQQNKSILEEIVTKAENEIFMTIKFTVYNFFNKKSKVLTPLTREPLKEGERVSRERDRERNLSLVWKN